MGTIVWLTGLSGSGKSTIANALASRLRAEEKLAYVLDGDQLRRGLCSDLGFSDADREENIRRAGEVAALFADAGLIVITAFISPFRRDRERVRALAGEERFVEIFLDAPLAICEQRDPKGLYAKARAGQIADFTGISSRYETPDAPAIVLRTAEHDVGACVEAIHSELQRRGVLR